MEVRRGGERRAWCGHGGAFYRLGEAMEGTGDVECNTPCYGKP
jgi:hypothetical protein